MCEHFLHWAGEELKLKQFRARDMRNPGHLYCMFSSRPDGNYLSVWDYFINGGSRPGLVNETEKSDARIAVDQKNLGW